MVSCCAEGCNSSSYKDWQLTFHRFPWNDPKRLDGWLKVCSTDHLSKHNSGQHHRLCSKHFAPEQYYFNVHDTRPKLVKSAIPFLVVQSQIPKSPVHFNPPIPTIVRPHPPTVNQTSNAAAMDDPLCLEWIGPDDMKTEPMKEEKEEEPDPLIQENIQLKARVEELTKQLSMMSNQVHYLNKQVGQLNWCICSNCLPNK